MAAHPETRMLRQLCRRAAVPDRGIRSDRDLLHAFVARRDEAAFALLVERHGPMVLRVCQRVLRHRQDAEDAFQATFLVLARRAAAVAWHTSVGGWLHAVARRLALVARARLARRKQRERLARQSPAGCPLAELTVREALQILDEELDRLAARYRLPLVLVFLEGATREEAARQLGWSLSTVKRRLAEGRERLRLRLGRRGLALPAAAAVALLEQTAAPAAVSAPLASGTVRAAVGYAGEQTLATLVRAPVVTLVRSGLRSLFLARLKVVLGVLLVLGALAAGTGLAARQGWAEGQTAEALDAPPRPPATADRRERADPHGDPLPPGALARLGTIRFRHENLPGAVTFTPDGQGILSGARDYLYRWDTHTGKLLWHRSAEDAAWVWVNALAVSPDGKFFAAGSSRGLSVWDLAAGKRLRRLEPYLPWVTAAAFAPDGQTLAAVGDEARVHVWNPTTGRERWVLEGHRGLVNCLACTPDGRYLVTGGDDGTVRLWELATGQEARQFGKPARNPGTSRSHNGKPWAPGQVAAVALSPDGKLLAAMRVDEPVRFWDVATGNEVRSLDVKGGAGGLAFSPDGQRLAAGIRGVRQVICDVATGKVLHEFDPEDGGQVAYSPDGNTLATWPHGHTFRLRDLRTSKPRLEVPGNTNAVMTLALSPDGRLLASGGWWSSQLQLWDPGSGKPLEALVGKPLPQSPLARWLGGSGGPRVNGLFAADFAPDGGTLAFATGDGTIHLWDTKTRQERLGFPCTQTRVVCLAFSPDGRLLATGGEDGSIVLWDPATGQARRRLKGHESRVVAVAFSPDGKRLASSCMDLRLWDVGTGKELASTERSQFGIFRVAFSPDGQTVASAASGDNSIRLGDAATLKETQRLRGQATSSQGVAFSPDGRTLAATTDEGDVRLIELATGQERRRYQGHHGEVVNVAFSRDGRRLASSSWDTTVLVWDLAGRTGEVGPLSAAALESAWANLASPEAASAGRAMDALLADPEPALALLKRRLRPVPTLSAGQQRQVGLLLADLDSERYALRRQATEALEQLGEAVEPLLRAALREHRALESRRRIERLLERHQGWTPERLRTIRSLEVLERLETVDVQPCLKQLSEGCDEALIAREARRALKRLAARKGGTNSQK